MPISIFFISKLVTTGKRCQKFTVLYNVLQYLFYRLYNPEGIPQANNTRIVHSIILGVLKSVPQAVNCQQTQYAYSVVPKTETVSRHNMLAHCSPRQELLVNSMVTQCCPRQKLLAHTIWLLSVSSQLRSKNCFLFDQFLFLFIVTA